MRVRFWGVRGSVPWSEPGSMAHGCNTACIEVTDEASGHGLVLDAGTGLIGVSGTLEEPPRAMPILLTHYHWDHVQGLPFFDPFYERGWSPGIWAPRLAGVDRTWIRTVFESPFWPMTYDQLPSRPEVTLLDPGTDRDWRVPRRGLVDSSPGRRLRVSDSWCDRRSGLRHRLRVRPAARSTRRSGPSRAARPRSSSMPISRRRNCRGMPDGVMPRGRRGRDSRPPTASARCGCSTTGRGARTPKSRRSRPRRRASSREPPQRVKGVSSGLGVHM